ncbi:MAG: FAD-dependent oxidoreductase [Chitinophagaceae bacterium]
MKWRMILLFCFCSIHANSQRTTRSTATQVLVIGGGVGGTAAAIQSARMGVKTILVEPTTMLGGMLTAAGVSCTDGNDKLPSGIWEEFRQALYKHYGKKILNSGWVSSTNFEPHVGDSIFKAWAAKEENLEVIFGFEFEIIKKNGNKVTGASFRNKDNTEALKIKADVVIDGTELGDVFAAAGAAYDVGMDDPVISGEKEARQKNDIIQDLTWAAILKDYGPGADKTIPRPGNYDSTKYFCSTSEAPCQGKPYIYDAKKVLNYGKLPRSPGAMFDKYMLNWPAHGNDIYLNVVEKSYVLRVKGYELARQYTLGFIYFMQTTLGMKNIGLADDELDGGLALIPYNREGRRVKGMVRMNINHIKNSYDYTLYRTGVAVGDYPVDHHHAQYPGKVPEIEFPHIPSYNIPLGALIPEKIDGLIVCEKGISVTNIVNGTTRLQPVVLLTGQAAGVLAALSVKYKKKPREVAVRMVQEELLKAKAYLVPFVDVKPNDLHWEAIQKVGVTGILKGTGKSEGWANKMFFYPDSTMKLAEYSKNLSHYMNLGYWLSPDTSAILTVQEAFDFLFTLYSACIIDPPGQFELRTLTDNFWVNKLGLDNFDKMRPIKKFEIATLLNYYLPKFKESININGKNLGLPPGLTPPAKRKRKIK